MIQRRKALAIAVATLMAAQFSPTASVASCLHHEKPFVLF